MKNNNIQKIFFLCIYLFIFSIIISNVSAMDISIDPSEATGINGALNNISENGSDDNTISLNPGTYDKTTDLGNNVNINSKNITIKGNGPAGSVIIDAKNNNWIFHITGSCNLTFINIKFINGYTSSSGGAIYHSSSGTLTLIDCVFENNNAYTGGAVYISGKNSRIINCIFNNNLARYNGGAIYSYYGDNIKIENSKFNNNRADNYGGAFYNYYTHNTSVNDCDFKNNTAEIYGGAIFNWMGENLIIYNSNFIKNIVNGTQTSLGKPSAGAFYNNDAFNTTISNCIFIDNFSPYNGGAINHHLGSNISIINSKFINNSALFGGAIFIDESSGTIIDGCNFTNNSAANDYGGAIYDMQSNYSTIKNSNFKNNNAERGGAIYYSRANNSLVENCEFRNNTVLEDGAGLYYSSGNNNKVTKSKFYNNTALRFGGGICNSNEINFYITEVDFKNNIANMGGAILNRGNNIVIINSNFTGNTANYTSAVYNNVGAGMIISGSDFINNIAVNDGTIYNGGSLSSINNKYIQNNKKHIIFNDQSGVMFLSNNTMNSNNFEKIYNMGLINSTVYVTYLHNNTLTGNPGDHFILNATITDDKGNCIVGQNVTFMIEKHNNTDINTFNNGYYYLNFTTKQINTYLISGVYHGGNNLTIRSGVIKIEKIPTNNQVNIPTEITVDDNITIESILTDKYGNPLANQTINFYINGIWIGSAITNNNGIAKLNYIFNKSGDYHIFTNFNETIDYQKSNATTDTLVIKIPTIIEISVDGDKITVTLKDKYGNPLEGKKIIFKIDNKIINSGTTNINGQIIIYYKNANKNKITVNFLGDNKYYSSNNTYTPKQINNDTNKTNHDKKINHNLADNTAIMKKTGAPISPILLALLVLLSSLGLLPRKNNKI